MPNACRSNGRNGSIAHKDVGGLAVEPRLQAAASRWKDKSLGHDANDLFLAVERDRLADERRIAAERARPESVAEDCDSRVLPVVIFRQRSTQRRRDAKNTEYCRRYASAVEPLWRDAARGVAARQISREPGIRLRQLTDNLKIRRREAELDRRVGELLIKQHELLWVAVRQRLQQHAVDDAENGGLAPMPSASVSTAAAAKPGVFFNIRKAYRRSSMVISRKGSRCCSR